MRTRPVNLTRGSAGAVLTGSALLTLSACQVPFVGGLDGSSTWADYAKASMNDRAKGVGELWVKAHPRDSATGMNAAGAGLNVDYACSQRSKSGTQLANLPSFR